jgi:hypothetical protein
MFGELNVSSWDMISSSECVVKSILIVIMSTDLRVSSLKWLTKAPLEMSNSNFPLYFN